MAYRKNYLDENQEGQALGSGGIIAGNAGQGAGQTAAGGGSGWTNLQQYLDANAGETGGLTNAFVGANQKSVDSAKAIGSDLVEKTKADDSWNAPIKEAKSIANEIRTGDVTKVDPTKYGQVAGSTYSKPKYGDLGGYGDALKAFSEAGNKVQNADNYNSQKAALQSEFGGSGNYGSGASTLDTFLLRADPNSKKAIQSFKETNKDYVAKPGENSARFNADVTDPLAAFFSGQENVFNTAKADLGQAVTDRIASNEAAIQGRRGTELDKARQPYLDEIKAQLNASDGRYDHIDPTKYLTANADYTAEDYVTDDDLAALAALEGLGGTTSLKRQATPDRAFNRDVEGLNKAKEAADLIQSLYQKGQLNDAAAKSMRAMDPNQVIAMLGGQKL